jgi:hypothetical protein
MQKQLLSLLFAITLCSSLSARQIVYDSIPINKDSIEREVNEFLKLFDSLHEAKSYFLVGAGVGNSQFSVKNIALNAKQTSKNVNISPVIGYYDKSGFNISYNNYLLLEQGNVTLLQHSLTAGYDYNKEKNAAFGFSYTRFIGKKEFVNASSPYDNDLFAYVHRSKHWFQPGLMMGFSAGKYREANRYLDSQYVTFPGPGYRYFYVNDTSFIRVRDFSFIPYVQLDFEWKGFGKKDLINFNPSLMFNSGLSKIRVDSKGTITTRRDLLLRLRYASSSVDKSSFNLQSLGLNINATWYIGKFYLNPLLYLDYYLLSSKEKFNAFYTTV